MNRKVESNFRNASRVFLGRGISTKICLVIIALFIFMAFTAPIITPYEPTAQSTVNAFEGPSRQFWLGTDNLGRDLYTRLIFGARISFCTSLLSSVIGAICGTILGLIAGYYKGFVSHVIMRITDAQLSMPPLVLSMVLASLFGGGVVGVSIVIGIALMPSYIRVVYGLVLSLKGNDYIVAARLIGQKGKVILLQHLLPNCFPSLIVLFTMSLGTAIMLEASLSFLGIGITPPTPAWGSMVSEGYKSLIMKPSLAILPGVFVLLTVVAFNIVGDGLRDALDPRLRGKL